MVFRINGSSRLMCTYYVPLALNGWFTAPFDQGVELDNPSSIRALGLAAPLAGILLRLNDVCGLVTDPVWTFYLTSIEVTVK